MGHQLGSQADPENNFSLVHAGPDKGFFLFHPGVLEIIVNPHGSAHDNQKIEGLRVGQNLTLEQLR